MVLLLAADIDVFSIAPSGLEGSDGTDPRVSSAGADFTSGLFSLAPYGSGDVVHAGW